jgi:hypothetical protein
VHACAEVHAWQYLQTDCVHRASVEPNLVNSPLDALTNFVKGKALLKDGGAESCPQCAERMSDLWCALGAQPCGTFAKQLVTGGQRDNLLAVLDDVSRETGGVLWAR